MHLGGGGGGTDTQDAEDRVEEDWACPQRPCPATQTPRCPMARLGPPKLLQTNLVQSPQGGKTSKRHQSLPWRDSVLARLVEQGLGGMGGPLLKKNSAQTPELLVTNFLLYSPNKQICI